jgi:hypothetical protein
MVVHMRTLRFEIVTCAQIKRTITLKGCLGPAFDWQKGGLPHFIVEEIKI